MKCPRCGAENVEGATWCYLCNHAFGPGDASGTRGVLPPQPPSPDSISTPQGGHMPPVPTPPPPPRRATGGGPSTVKVLSAILVVLVLVGGVLGAAFLLVGRKASIEMPTPPGWEAADQETMDRFKKMSEGAGKVTIDRLFTDGSLTNFILVAHGHVYLLDSPDGEDLAAVEDFFYQHKTELIEQLEQAYSEENAAVHINTYEVREMACGIPALHLDLTAGSAGVYLQQYFLFFFKDDTMYFALINKMTGQGAEADAEFLSQNITF